MAKGKKKGAKNKGKEAQDVKQPDVPADDGALPAPPEDAQAESLVVVEVFEARSHHKLAAGQQVATVFDGEDIYQVVTNQPVQQDDLVVFAKPGCVIPGTQQRAGVRKVNGVKSQGHICNAFEVGWQEEPTEEYLCVDEDWNMISGDVCPMGPPQGWIQQHAELVADFPNEDTTKAKPGLRDSVTDEAAVVASQNKTGTTFNDSGDDSIHEMHRANVRSDGKAGGAGVTDAFVGLVASNVQQSDTDDDPMIDASKGMNAFAGLMGSDDDDDQGDSDQHETAFPVDQTKAANAFAGLMGSDDDDDQGDSDEDEPASQQETVNHKKAANAFAGLMGSTGSDVSDGSQDDGEHLKDDAPSKYSNSKGVNAFAGLMGSEESEDESESVSGDGSSSALQAQGRSQNSRRAKAIDSFAGLVDMSGSDDDSIIKAPSHPGSSEKIIQQPKIMAHGEAATEDHTADQGTEVSSTFALHAGAEKVDLLTLPMDALTTIAQVQEAMEVEGVSKTRKQKLKQRLKKLQEAKGEGADITISDRDPASLPVEDLTTVQEVEAAMNAPAVSKTRKQKLKQRLRALQETADGAAAQFGTVTQVMDTPIDSMTTVEQLPAALNDPNVSKTRRQKLKQRLKQLQEASSSSKGKKVSSAVAAMQRELEERRKAEETAKKALEEKRLAEEAAILQTELEEQRRQEAEEARAKAKRLERERLRKEGKLLSAKQRADAKRLAAQREMFLARAQEVGITGGANPTPAQLEERRRQAKKRQKEIDEQRARDKEAAEQAERERKRQAEKAAQAQRKKEAEAEATTKSAAAVAPADNWEDEVPDEWDACEDGDEPSPSQTGDVQLADSLTQEQAHGESSEQDVCDDSGSDDASSDDDDDSSSGLSTDSEEERERRLEEARARREARFKEAMGHRNKDDLRSPICCILGHVDTGKTKILDNIRRTNVQIGEAGGITQQIGATYIPSEAVKGRTEELRKGKVFDMKMPGLLVIDTPGHESFSNLRSRGSSLCDIAVLVVDIMHGLEQQTIESINLLKMRKSPFIIALNKIDRMYNWKVHQNDPVRDSLSKQEKATREEFDTRCRDSMLALNEQGLNVELYWKNKDPRRFVNIVPTSAITGEGVCDLMWLIVKLTQNMMMDRLMFVEELQCTVLEVKVVEGYGHTIDAVLINGRIREGDKVVICGLQGPIVTTVRSLLTPHPLKELRVKNTYIHHKEIKAAQGIKISAPNLESAVAGTQLFVVGKDDDEDELRDLVMEDMSDIFDKKEPEGVCVQASTLGSLEALLEFLSSEAVQIPVSGINIGPVHKKDVMRANIMNEKKLKKFSCILAFDVPITREAQTLAQSLGVTVFAADIIYHLFDMFTEYTQRCKAEEKSAAATKAVFPCRLRIVPNCIFNAKDPIVLGCEVLEGQLRMGTPITVPLKDCDLGKVIGLEKDHKAVEIVERGDSAAVKIEATNSVEASKLVGRHFVESDELVSKVSRESIDALKAHFRDEMTRPLWELVIKLKKVFKID